MGDELFKVLCAAVGKTIVAVRHQEIQYALSGKDIEYAIKDDERILSETSQSGMLVEFTDTSEMLLVYADYDGNLNANWVAADSEDAKRFSGEG